MRKKQQSQSGFMLIEVLISVLVFSVGVLAIVALQVAITSAQTEAKARADASNLASELVGLMWSDVTNIGNYTSANCAGYNPCNLWLTKVQQTLPASSTNAPAVTVDTTAGGATQGDVSITIQWQLPNGLLHKYTMATSIKT